MISEKVISSARKHGRFTFDVEHDKNTRWTNPKFEIWGCSFATPDIVVYVEDPKEVSSICRTLFAEEIVAIAFNGKYDMMCLVSAELVDDFPKLFADPMIAANLLDDNRMPKDLGLKRLSADWLDHKMTEFDEAYSCGRKSVQFKEYAMDDARQELRLYDYCIKRLKDGGLEPLFTKILCPSSKVFADIEMYGIGWDWKRARRTLQGLRQIKNETEREIRQEIGDINLNSGDQLAKRLYGDLGYDTTGIERTPKGSRFSTDAKALDTLAPKYPVADNIRLFKTVDKLINTFVVPLTKISTQDSKNRIHPTFWLTSSTGRTRSEKPNFQNIPAHMAKKFEHDPRFKDLNIRDLVVPEEGKKFIVADLSQIELRVCAHISEDPGFLKAYRNWTCNSCSSEGVSKSIILHKCPKCGAAENEKILYDKLEDGFWHGLDLHQQTCDLVEVLKDRQDGKASNFALIYYATARRMHYEHPQYSINQWQRIIDQYFHVYAGVRRWHDRMERSMWQTGTCTDIFGRKRRITKSNIKRNAKHALNQFINFPVQSSACELIQLSMVKMRDKWKEQGTWKKEINISNFVHDEVVFEVAEEKVENYLSDIQEYMENCVELRVPIRTEMVVCDRWGAAK